MHRRIWTRSYQLDRMSHGELLRAYFLYPAIQTYLALAALSLYACWQLAEAVLPLDPLLSALAAIADSGSGSQAPIVTVYNTAGDVAQVGEPRVTRGPDGRHVIEMMVERAVRGSFARGGLRSDMSQLHGLQPQPTMR